MVEGHYEFGENWRRFVQQDLDDDRVAEAVRSLRDFLRVSDLADRSFLDIGCGSGLFSLAAHRLGAKRIVSFDLDPDSVGCCKALREREGSPESWLVRDGSVLDQSFLNELGEFDLVYSWGVLHHTGSMWEAISNAAQRVAPGGALFIAIYNRADGIGIYSDGRVGSSRFWEREKKFYNALPDLGRKLIDTAAASGMIAAYLLTGRNPIKEIREHRTLRGMSWMVDIRDWLGGYPYEYATVAEIFEFVHERFGFTLENLCSTNSLRNNEFLFRRASS